MRLQILFLSSSRQTTLRAKSFAKSPATFKSNTGNTVECRAKSSLLVCEPWAMLPTMHPQTHRGRKWRRFLRHNQGLFLMAVLLVIILAIVGAFFYVMSSGRFLKAGE
jgi:hypothetical protein